MKSGLLIKRKQGTHVELGSGSINSNQKRAANKLSIDVTVKSKSRKHKQIDFIEGLSRLKDNSIDTIPANASLGYYTKNAGQIGILRKTPLVVSSIEGQKLVDYTTKVLKVAHQKLRKEGKVIVRIDEDFIEAFIHAVKHSPFTQVSIQELEKKHLNTPWLKIIGAEKKVFEITLVKS
jgi:hypothetical protein